MYAFERHLWFITLTFLFNLQAAECKFKVELARTTDQRKTSTLVAARLGPENVSCYNTGTKSDRGYVKLPVTL